MTTAERRREPGQQLRVDSAWARLQVLDVCDVVDPSGRPARCRHQARTIRIPTHVVEREYRIARAERELWQKLRREPTAEELAQATSLPLHQVEQVRSAPRAVASLDRPLGNADGATLGDLVPGEEVSPTRELEVSLREDVLRRAVAELPEEEREVVFLRYGLDEEPKTVREVARAFELEREPRAGNRSTSARAASGSTRDRGSR